MVKYTPSFEEAVLDAANRLAGDTSAKKQYSTFADIRKTLKVLWNARQTDSGYHSDDLTHALDFIPTLAAMFRLGCEDFQLDEVGSIDSSPMTLNDYEVVFRHNLYLMDRQENYPWLSENMDDDYDNLKSLYVMHQKGYLNFELIEAFISEGAFYTALAYRWLKYPDVGHKAKCA